APTTTRQGLGGNGNKSARPEATVEAQGSDKCSGRCEADIPTRGHLSAERESLMGFHPSVASVLQYFDFRHLPESLQAISRPFAMVAMRLALDTDSSPELTVSLRKLLEAKDAAVRAAKGGDAQSICSELMSALDM